jgi:hyperosmotically inducible protein
MSYRLMTLVLVTTVLAAHTLTACAGGARPYRAMAKAASSEESVFSQAEDHRLGIALREALVGQGLGMGVKPYVHMGHVYLVGFVSGEAERQNALAAARGVEGVRSVDSYLPDRPAGGSTEASDLTLEGEVKAALVLDQDQPVTRIDLEILAGHVVLLGVVSSEEARQAVAADVARVNGVSGVSNFLLVPEADYERLRPGLR